MGIKHEHLPQYKGRFRVLLFAVLLPAMLFTRDTLHTQLTTVHLKFEQPSNGQGMEIGE